MKRLTVVTLAAVAVLIGLAACDKVPKPTSDSTKPSIAWHVTNGNNQTDINGDGTVNAKNGDTVQITLTAKDPEGIHKISLGGASITSCTDGQLGQSATGDFATKTQNLNPDADNKVLTSIILVDSYSADPSQCHGSFVFNGETIDLIGTGENYFNGKTTGNLKIKFAK